MPLNKRVTIRRLISATKNYKLTLQDWKKKGTITYHESFIKRIPMDNNKMEKMKFAIPFIH